MKHLTFSFLLVLLTTIFSYAQVDKVYGLNFVSSNAVQFASMNLANGSVDVISNGAISPDQFASGVADFDPVTKSYFYIRGISSNSTIYQVDAQLGTVVHQSVISNPNNVIGPITNIAFNWLEDKLYGVSHSWNGVSDVLEFATVDPSTGAMQVLSPGPISLGSYISGNSDIDPIHRKYYYGTPDTIYTVDLNTGNAVSTPLLFPGSIYTEQFINLTYNWLDQQIYGLYFLSIPDPNPFDNDIFTSELYLAKVNPQTGVITVISQQPTSNDGFSSGDCDIDPTNYRYMYIRQGSMYQVDLQTGDVLSVTLIENTNNAVAPIINMAYDELIDPVPNLTMTMEDIVLGSGETKEVNVWVGDDVTYLWNDGSTDPIRTITQPGTYSVEISRAGFTVNGSAIVEMSTSVDGLLQEEKSEFSLYPTPSTGLLNFELMTSTPIKELDFEITDASGRLVWSKQLATNSGQLDVSLLSNGVYFVRLKGFTTIEPQRIVIAR